MRAARLFVCVVVFLLLNPAYSYAQNIAGPCTGANKAPNLTLKVDGKAPNLTVKVDGVDEPVYHVGCDVKPPEIVSEPKPRSENPNPYGAVVVAMVLTSKGDIVNARVVGVEGKVPAKQLARAIEAASQYRFKPSTLLGKPVSVQIAIEVSSNVL